MFTNREKQIDYILNGQTRLSTEPWTPYKIPSIRYFADQENPQLIWRESIWKEADPILRGITRRGYNAEPQDLIRGWVKSYQITRMESVYEKASYHERVQKERHYLLYGFLQNKKITADVENLNKLATTMGLNTLYHWLTGTTPYLPEVVEYLFNRYLAMVSGKENQPNGTSYNIYGLLLAALNPLPNHIGFRLLDPDCGRVVNNAVIGNPTVSDEVKVYATLRRGGGML